jgi:L-alanine-DL-glutamate epimerase-like enolase superfamily enzyme
MRIRSVDIYKSDIPLKEPFRTAILEVSCAQSVFIKINTEDGLYGLGEANPSRVLTGETQSIDLATAPDLARLILGKDPLDIENRMTELGAFLARNNTLRSAFDMALYDLLGKSSGKPLYSILGGGKRSFWTDNTISIADPREMARRATELKDQGFKAIKVKLGTGCREDVERIYEIRRAIGEETPIRIDANQGWDCQTAISVLRSLEQMGIDYCEQPVAYWDFEGMRHVRQKSPIPIMADESLFDHHDAFKLASMGCCDYFNIKLSKSGGLHTALKINAIAEGAGIRCMMGCRIETRLGLSAAAHLVSARPNIRFADLDGHLMLTEDPITGGASYDIGEINLPETPGHGADIDPAFLGRCERTTVK